jgi:hypothetical protein
VLPGAADSSAEGGTGGLEGSHVHLLEHPAACPTSFVSLAAQDRHAAPVDRRRQELSR